MHGLKGERVLMRVHIGERDKYKGKPLYYFSMDKAAGDKAGDGRGMVWHVATP